VAAGRITEQWDQADMLGLLQQLGALPSAAEASIAAEAPAED
jgi:hypothetical protein